jgi:hypothetical protein
MTTATNTNTNTNTNNDSIVTDAAAGSIQYSITPAQLKISPSEAAFECTIQFITSLHPLLQQQTTTHVKRAITRYTNVLRLESNIKRIRPDDFIPRSIRLNLSLKGSKSAMDSPEFSKLQDEANDKLLSFQSDYKTSIIKMAELELQVAQKAMLIEIFQGIAFLADGFYAMKDLPLTPQNIYHFFSYGAKSSKIHDLLQELSVTHDDLEQHIGITIPDPVTNLEVVTPLHTEFRTLVKMLFLAPRIHYQDAITSNATNLSIKAVLTRHKKDLPTATLVLNVENEPTIDQQTIGKLIERKIKSSLDKRLQKISVGQTSNTTSTTTTKNNSTKKNITKSTNDNKYLQSSKNFHRGANIGAPSSKKITSTKTSSGKIPGKLSRSKQTKKVADRNNDLPNANNNNGKHSVSKKSGNNNIVKTRSARK